MDPALLTVAAGLRTQLETLELIGNNIANLSTAGYKGDSEFHRLFITEAARAEPYTGEAHWMPFLEGSKIDFRQGPLTATEGALDVALSGPGFLAVATPSGTFYTRNGSLDRSSTGRLQTREGHAVLDSQGGEINLPATGEIEIGPDGVIQVDGIEVAQLGIVEFDGRPPLSKAGNSYFNAAPGQEPRPATETVVHQGRLEGSNVNGPESAVRLMLATRNFETLRRVASLIGDEINGRAVEELGRLS